MLQTFVCSALLTYGSFESALEMKCTGEVRRMVPTIEGIGRKVAPGKLELRPMKGSCKDM